MGRFVIAAYRPKPGQQVALHAVVAEHGRVLREQGLITEQMPQVMQAADGSLIEVFEWQSAQAVAAAHDNPAVQALWARFASACDYVPLNTLAEAQEMFAEFEAVAAPAEGPA